MRGQHSHEKLPEDFSSDLRTTLPIYRSCKRPLASPIARQIGVDPSTSAASLFAHRRARLSLRCAREGLAETPEASDKPRNDARFGGADRTRRAVVRSDQRASGEDGSPLSVTAHLRNLERQETAAVSNCVTAAKIQQAQGRIGARADSNRVDSSAASYCRRKKPQSWTTRLSAPITKALSCRTLSEPPNTPSSPTAGQEHELSCRPAHAALAAR